MIRAKSMWPVLMACGLSAVSVAGRSGAAAGRSDAESTREVFVSIVPQQYFVERIGGERIVAHVLVQPGHSPATYEPTAKQMAALSEADVYFRIGAPFENAFLPKIEKAFGGLKIVDTREGIELRSMQGRHERHDHGDGHGRHGRHGHSGHDGDGAESSEGKDPHIWLSPRLAKRQARTIAEALARIDPEGKDVYARNYQALAQDLDALDKELAEALAPVKGETLMVFHPSWGYFADAYGLKQQAVEVEGKAPSARQLARIVDRAQNDGVKVIFAQPQFSAASAQAIAAAIGAAVVPIDPLAKDYIANLREVARKVSQALNRGVPSKE